MLGVMLLTRWYISQLVLDDCEHLADRCEDASGKFVLVIDSQPATKHLCDVGLKDLRDLQLDEWLLVQHSVVLVRLWTLSETAIVLRCAVHLHEDVFCIGLSVHVEKVIRRLRIVRWILFEAFQSFQVHNLLDNVQALLCCKISEIAQMSKSVTVIGITLSLF